jgi:hypothetical protein
MDDTAHIPTPMPSVTARRNVLKGAGAALAALVLSATDPRAQGHALAATTLQNLSDVDILNFVLRIEHLEAAFYEQAVASGNLSGDALTLLTRIRDHENGHIARLTQTVQNLGGTPQGRESYTFGALDTQDQILAVAQRLEELGVGAYSGAARFVSNKSTILAALASVLQIENRHTAVIRTLRGGSPTTGAYGSVLQTNEATNQIAQFVQ